MLNKLDIILSTIDDTQLFEMVSEVEHLKFTGRLKKGFVTSLQSEVGKALNVKVPVNDIVGGILFEASMRWRCGFMQRTSSQYVSIE